MPHFRFGHGFLIPAFGAVALLAAATAARPVCAQTSGVATPIRPARLILFSFADAISGKAAPVTLHLKNLTGEWRRLTLTYRVGDKTETGAFQTGVYYTKGQMIQLATGEFLFGDSSFLVAYQLTDKGDAGYERINSDFNSKPTPEATLSLSLISLASAHSINTVQPFNLASDTVSIAQLQQASQNARNQSSEDQLRAYGSGLLNFTKENKGVLPPMQTLRTFEETTRSYPRFTPRGGFGGDIIGDTAAKQPFLPNPSLSGKTLVAIQKPEAVVAFYEAVPAADSTRAAVFLDGRVRRFSEREWPGIARASGITASSAAAAVR